MYVDAAHHDLSRTDEQILALLSPLQSVLHDRSRRAKVLQAISKRACVDSHPHTSRLRHGLHDQDNYARDVQYSRKPNPVRFRRLRGEAMEKTSWN